LLVPAGAAPLDQQPYVTLANPISAERTSMRHSLLASVLEVMAGNVRQRERTWLFEIGQVYLMREGELLPDEIRRLVIAISGPRHPEAWQAADTRTPTFTT